MIDIGSVTTWLVSQLGNLVLCGDGEAPLEAGWPEGQPNVGVFVPYLVLRQSGPVTSQLVDVPLCDSNARLYRMPYNLRAFDITRVAADELASDARALLHDLTGEVATGDLVVRSDQTYITSAQGALRDDSTFPKLWSAETNFTVNVARP